MARPLDARRADELATTALVGGPVVGYLGGVLVAGYDVAAITGPVGAIVGLAVAYAIDRRASRLPRPYRPHRRIV